MRVILLDKKRLLQGAALVLLVALTAVVLGVSVAGGSREAWAASKKPLPIYNVDTAEKKVCVTFDAAWGDEETDGILDLLDKYNVKATFFLVGYWVDKYPEHVREIAARGHEIGNHSSTHPHMSGMSGEMILREIQTNGQKIQALTGQTPVNFRPPYGGL